MNERAFWLMVAIVFMLFVLPSAVVALLMAIRSSRSKIALNTARVMREDRLVAEIERLRQLLRQRGIIAYDSEPTDSEVP